MLILNTAGQALYIRLLAGERVDMVSLVHVATTPAQYITTAGRPVPYAGNTYQPVGLVLEVLAHGTAGEADQLKFTLPGVTDEQLQAALDPAVDGAQVLVYDALLDPATGEPADAKLAWAGTLGRPGIEDGAEAAVAWVAENRRTRALRLKPSRYTSEEQQRLYPGDTSLEFDPATDAAPLPWPAASYFKQ